MWISGDLKLPDMWKDITTGWELKNCTELNWQETLVGVKYIYIFHAFSPYFISHKNSASLCFFESSECFFLLLFFFSQMISRLCDHVRLKISIWNSAVLQFMRLERNGGNRFMTKSKKWKWKWSTSIRKIRKINQNNISHQNTDVFFLTFGLFISTVSQQKF